MTSERYAELLHQLRVSYHEAGHAVVSYALGYEPTLITNLEHKHNSGAACGGACWLKRIDEVEHDAIITLAGIFAQSLIDTDDSRAWADARTDIESISDLAISKYRIPHIVKRASHLIQQHATDITALAILLMARHTLLKEDIIAFMKHRAIKPLSSLPSKCSGRITRDHVHAIGGRLAGGVESI